MSVHGSYCDILDNSGVTGSYRFVHRFVFYLNEQRSEGKNPWPAVRSNSKPLGRNYDSRGNVNSTSMAASIIVIVMRSVCDVVTIHERRLKGAPSANYTLILTYGPVVA